MKSQLYNALLFFLSYVCFILISLADKGSNLNKRAVAPPFGSDRAKGKEQHNMARKNTRNN